MTRRSISWCRIWGARGSLPATPAASQCRLRQRHLQRRDALRRARADLRRRLRRRGPFELSHAERGQGFRPLLLALPLRPHHGAAVPEAALRPRGVTARIYAGHFEDGTTCQQMAEGFMAPPYFPVTPKYFDAQIAYLDFRPPDTLTPHEGIVIQTHQAQPSERLRRLSRQLSRALGLLSHRHRARSGPNRREAPRLS